MKPRTNTGFEPVESAFALSELNRVGTAAAMMVIGGTMVILCMTMLLGHYNSLAQCGPKAVLDGLTLALLMGKRSRWRCLALLGIVYGLVLVLQVGVVYLLGVMSLAGGLSAIAGWITSRAHRTTALYVSAVCFEILAGCGTPIKILLATRHGDEPVLWMMWFAEWPLRAAGAAIGVWLAARWLRSPRHGSTSPRTCSESQVGSGSTFTPAAARRQGAVIRAKGRGQAAIRLAAAVAGCLVPMLLSGWLALGITAIAALVYGWWAGLRRHVFSIMAALIWGWVICSFASFLWHHDKARTVDLVRTFILGMCPLAVSAAALILTTRPVDLVRVLRRLFVPKVVLLPVAQIARQVPPARSRFAADLASLRADGTWSGSRSLLRHPLVIARRLMGSQLEPWMLVLAEESFRPPALMRTGPMMERATGTDASAGTSTD